MKTWKPAFLPALFLFLFLASMIFSGGKISAQQEKTERPRIGLVLSGGGAKGLAHIGVLKVLEKHNIPIDYITGTSMGSIVGALYALGYSADAIERIARDINWADIFEGSVNRIDISVEEKDEADRYLLEFPIKNAKVVLPKGLISGQKLEMLLAKLTWSVHGQNDFSKFHIPFKCIATDIETGNAYVLDHGFLPDALRASMAIPSVFTPVVIDGKLLVDGGIVRNLPASDVKEMGADFIIGVNVGSPLYKKEELSSMLAIMDQAASFRNAAATKKEKKLCNLLISPDITGYSAASFDAIDSLINNGVEAALAHEQEIIELAKALKVNEEKPHRFINPTELHSLFINEIQFKGVEKVSMKLIKSRLNIKDSSWVAFKDIEKGVDRLFGTQFFDKVNYRIIQGKEKNILLIRVVEKPFSRIKIGANYNNYLNASLLLNGTFRNILGEGSKLLLSGKLSTAPEAVADYSIFTKIKPSIGFRARLEYFKLNEKLYFQEDSINLNRSRHNFSAKVGIVSSLTNSIYLAAGAIIDYRNFNVVELNPKDYERSLSYFKLFGEIYIDKLDRSIFPNKGASFNAEAHNILSQLIKGEFPFNSNYWKFDFAFKNYYPIGAKLNFKYSIYGATIPANNIFSGDKYYLGGDMDYKNYIFPLSGFRFMEYDTKNFIASGLGFRFEPWKDKYVFMWANGGFYNDELDKLINADEFLFGALIGVGAKTIIGPVKLNVSMNNQNKKVGMWVQIGYLF